MSNASIASGTPCSVGGAPATLGVGSHKSLATVPGFSFFSSALVRYWSRKRLRSALPSPFTRSSCIFLFEQIMNGAIPPSCESSAAMDCIIIMHCIIAAHAPLSSLERPLPIIIGRSEPPNCGDERASWNCSSICWMAATAFSWAVSCTPVSSLRPGICE